MAKQVLIYIVMMRDDWPDAVFSSFEDARGWAAEHGYRADPDGAVVGPYVLDQPDVDLPAWWEASTS